MSNQKRKLGRGLNELFGGDVTSLIEDIENNTPKSRHIKIPLD